MQLPAFFGIRAAPSPRMRWVLALAPFAILIAVYLVASHLRLAANPDDKILPSLPQMADAVERLAFEPDPRSGEYVMVRDTLSSDTPSGDPSSSGRPAFRETRRALLGGASAGSLAKNSRKTSGLESGATSHPGPRSLATASVEPCR